ncbi:YncE family protein [Nocardia cyriacigeorgica]|uniref:YncE family protein n=1 Tax=Nocardia cyriacigeorgica TaxID=135487 RepID=UPI002453BC73|nr:hypothetical protein [Nocardia cyriacigeorgica]
MRAIRNSRRTPRAAILAALVVGATAGCSTGTTETAEVSRRTATSATTAVSLPAGPAQKIAVDTWPSGIEVDGSTGEVYVLGSDEILVFTQGMNGPTNRIPTHPGTDDIAFDRMHHTAWVSSNLRSNAPEDHKVNILDTQSKQMIGTVEVSHPVLAVGVDPLAHRAFVVNRPDDQTAIPDSRAWVTVFDTRTRAPITTIELPFAAYEIDIDPNAHTAVISGWLEAATMSTQIHDVDRSRSVASESSSMETTIDTERELAYVVSDGTLSTISTGDNGTVSERKVEWEEGSMDIGPDGTILVSDHENRGLMVIDPATGALLGRIPAGVAPSSIATTPDRRTAYISSNADKAISVIRFA